ncbi:MAG: hypothetical protein ACYDCU_15450 [Candidatus Acidiferrales bacterium]
MQIFLSQAPSFERWKNALARIRALASSQTRAPDLTNFGDVK